MIRGPLRSKLQTSPVGDSVTTGRVRTRRGTTSARGSAFGILATRLVAAAAVVALAGWTCRGHASVLPQDASDPAATDAAFFRGVAENPTNPLEIRRVALVRLLSDPQPAGPAAVVSLFGDSTDAVRSGLVAAFANAPVEAPDLADALAAAAAAAAPDARGAWISLLDLAGPGMDALLVELAKDQALATERRTSAIDLLGGFSTPLAAETLMDLAEQDATEGVRSAAFDALRRLSGMPFGDRADAWRAWWAAGGEELLESTCEQRAETLAARLERADRDRKTARTLADRAVEQLRVVHAELLLGMDPAARQERILRLLGSEFESLRRLAIEQVERMLRNGDRIDDPEIPAAIETLLDDRVAALRAKATSLLGTLAAGRVVELVSARLPGEREATVANAQLEVLGGVPTPETIDAVVTRLDAAETADAAARALIRFHAAGAEPGPWGAKTATAARVRLDQVVSPAMLELLALTGDESDDDRLRGILESEDPRLRRAVADGWGRRGRIEALRELAADPVVYPALATAICDRRPPFEAIEILLALPRSDASAEDFERATMRLIDAMPIERLPEVDRRLADATPPVPVDLRRRGLRRVVDAPAEAALEPVFRIDAVERLGRLLIDASLAEEAVQTLQSQVPLAPERLSPLLFEALVLAAEFDAAAARRPEAGAWIELLSRLGETEAARREAIALEIAKRFPDALEADQWEVLRTVVPSLGPVGAKADETAANDGSAAAEVPPGD